MSVINSVSKYNWLDGKLQYCSLSEESQEAEVIAYHSNGHLRFKYPVRNGQFHGLGRLWDENGLLQREEEYSDGKLNGVQREWHGNGQLEKEAFYKNGLREGSCKIWYEDGTLRSSSFFVSGNTDGLWTIWYPNGRVHFKCNYQNGRLHGVSQKWDESGKLKSKEVFIRGLKVPVKIADLIASKNLTAQDILKVKNLAVRRLCLEELGYARFLSQVEHIIVDKDADNELVRINWHKREEPICLVKVKCPSTGAFYALRVPPEIRTVKEAVAWTFGVEAKSYLPEQET